MGIIQSVDMSGPLAKRIQDEIAEHKVVFYSKSHCRYCTMVKNIFKETNVSYHLVELDMQPESSQIYEILRNITRGRMAPLVFINGKHIGNAEEVIQLYHQRKLQQMLADS